MGSKASTLLREEEILVIQKETGFTENQIIRFFHRFRHLDKDQNAHISRNDLLRIPELAINPLADRIIDVFMSGSGGDPEGLNFRQFVNLLAVFRPADKASERTSREAKIEFAFKLYDIQGNKVVTEADLVHVLEMMIGNTLDSKQINAIAKHTIEHVTGGKDNCITLEDFKRALQDVDIEDRMAINFIS